MNFSDFGFLSLARKLGGFFFNFSPSYFDLFRFRWSGKAEIFLEVKIKIEIFYIEVEKSAGDEKWKID